MEIFLSHGISTWPTRVISKDANLLPVEINRIADWLNDTHDAGSIHASYWERVESVKEYMTPEYQSGKFCSIAKFIVLGTGYVWSKIKANFLSSWFSESNMKKAGLLISALQPKPRVSFQLQFITI